MLRLTAYLAAVIVALSLAFLAGWALMPHWRIITWHTLSGACYTESTDGGTLTISYKRPCD